ncbi:uncharacterized protein MYCGRDRAFT_41898 [Zymoseptoria tritici IPO323]|uniref:FAD/NAD(P)-binding domain-containing protein n=1 Tax=Zymoseptoria tritici (strain CBS 115943 / IPO323) TaxID=336722 RepID=F9XBK1_ZYMTI|nr:uncharacterized protein MYCGRDRAFT_41898 [Zymoseptoria tritici IPO323]EGP87381.1 hypothetical protein MYCGRDRAFT_41898 [Zymoseptoria tritici IPO323]
MGSAAPALIDVLIVGGGPAGLAVATGLARQPYTAVVFESGVYRNARTNHMHNVVTWDHRDPADFRAKARADLWARYDTIRIEDAKIENIRWNGDGRFEAIDGKGNVWTGKKVALAVGMEDVYPDIPGYDDVWARGVYHCLFCDGYEDRGVESVGILALGVLGKLQPAVHTARMAKRLTSSVTIYTDGDAELESQIRNVLGEDSVFEMDNRKVTRLEKVKGKASEVIVHVQDGSKVMHGFMVIDPTSRLTDPSPRSMELADTAVIKTSSPWYETSVPGVFAVGDCASPVPAVPNAMSMGAFAAAGLARQLGAE